jgi:nucleoside-diphosphate-sugar epimerase
VRVLLTGSEGYLGRLTAPVLSAAGHDVVGLDTCFYGGARLYHDGVDRPPLVVRDVRRVELDDLVGVDAVVHMGELSNDPLGELRASLTDDVNARGSARLAGLAKQAGVQRFVYMSSCSVYGVAEGDDVSEGSPIAPQTAYARCKAEVEQSLAELEGPGFSTTALRNATAFGASPAMRFDIVLNNLAGLAHTTGVIAMSSDGSPWRPLVHGLDIAAAVREVLAAPTDAVAGQVFNVGSDAQNYRVRDIAEHVAAAFPGCELSFGAPGADNRSYRVRFDKLHEHLPGFRCAWDAAAGARQLAEVFRRISLDDATFTGRGHTRLAQLQHLLSTRQLDDDLYWRAA